MILLRRGGFLAALFWLLGLSFAQAQLYHHITLPVELAQGAGAYPVYVAQVVDARANKSSLGWLYTGLENKHKLGRFRQGLEQELTSFFKQAIRTPEAHPLVLVVRRLNITEHIGGVTSEYALAELVADFYYRSTSGYYLAHHATELASSQALDVTSQHPQLISEVLLHGLASLKTWTPEQVSTDTPLTWDQVMGGSVTAHYPAQSATALRDGIYRTVADFRQNTPQEGIECKVRYSGNGLLTAMGTLPMNVKLRDASGESLDEAQLWGFCSGTQPYIRHGNSFYPLIRTESGYEYEAPIYLDPRQRSATFTYTPVGIFSRQSPPLTAATFRVQLDTGFANDDTPATNRADTPATTATVIVYRRPDAVPNKAVQVRMNGQAVGSLQTGEYLSLTVPAVSQADISVCGQTERESCFQFRPDAQATNYLDCRLGTATQPAPTLRLVSVDAGAAAVQSCTMAVTQK